MGKNRVSFGGASVSFFTPTAPSTVSTSSTVDATDGSVDGGKTVSRRTLRGVDVGAYVAIVDGSHDNIGLRGYVVKIFDAKKGRVQKLLLEIRRAGVAVRFANASVTSVRVLDAE